MPKRQHVEGGDDLRLKYHLSGEMRRLADKVHLLAERAVEDGDRKFALECFKEARMLVRIGAQIRAGNDAGRAVERIGSAVRALGERAKPPRLVSSKPETLTILNTQTKEAIVVEQSNG